jgi:serine/threonine protein phosphatase PrpC
MSDIAIGEKKYLLLRPAMSNSYQITPSIYHRLALGSAYGLTDVGLVRKSNEDNFVIDAEIGLVAVADGMGGHQGGEIASHTALSALRESLLKSVRARGQGKVLAAPAPDQDPDATWRDQHMPDVVAVYEAVEFANAQVYAANVRNENTEGGGMGTTLTGFWHSSDGGPLIVFHVGDSRLYRLRKGELSILTRDQTLYQQALEEGMSDSFPPRNLLLQAIGPGESVAPDVKICACEEGDLLMLCSDGLYGNPPHSAIAEVLARANAQSLDQCCADLIELAKAHGSRDNITAVLALWQR